MITTYQEFIAQGWGMGENGWEKGVYISLGANPFAAYQMFLNDTMQTPEWVEYYTAAANQPANWEWLSGDGSQGTQAYLLLDRATNTIYINPHAPNVKDWNTGNIDPVTGYIIVGANTTAIADAATRMRNARYTGSGDIITRTLDTGAGVYAFMAAVGYLAISGAGIGVANEVTQAVQTGSTIANDAATVVANAGEQAAQTIAQNTELLTTAEGNVIDASLTQTPGVTTTPYIDYSLQPWQITPLAPVTSISLPQTPSPPNIPQSGGSPPTVPTTPSAAEQAAKLLKDQAVKIATGGASTLLKTLTSGNNANVAPRGYIRNPQTGELTIAPQSDSVLPLAVIAALLMFS